jgi:NitT/TauT family transport system permease protein
MQQWWVRSERVRWLLMMLAGLLAFWEAMVWFTGVKPFILPAPSQIGRELVTASGYFLGHAAYTMGTTLLGFAIAVVGGVAGAIGIVYSKVLNLLLSSLLVSLNSVPKVALAPLFVIWMGTGVEPKIAIVVMIAIFPIVIDTVMGLKSVDPEMLNLARSCRASSMKTLWKIRFPNALPSVFSGMKVGISFALVGAIVGEFVAGSSGLGYVILIAQGNFDTPRVFAALVLLGLLGTVLFYLVDLAESLCLPWHVSQRGDPHGNPLAALGPGG